MNTSIESSIEAIYAQLINDISRRTNKWTRITHVMNGSQLNILDDDSQALPLLIDAEVPTKFILMRATNGQTLMWVPEYYAKYCVNNPWNVPWDVRTYCFIRDCRPEVFGDVSFDHMFGPFYDIMSNSSKDSLMIQTYISQFVANCKCQIEACVKLLYRENIINDSDTQVITINDKHYRWDTNDGSIEILIDPEESYQPSVGGTIIINTSMTHKIRGMDKSYLKYINVTNASDDLLYTHLKTLYRRLPVIIVNDQPKRVSFA